MRRHNTHMRAGCAPMREIQFVLVKGSVIMTLCANSWERYGLHDRKRYDHEFVCHSKRERMMTQYKWDNGCVCACACPTWESLLRAFASPINNSLRLFPALECLQHLNVVRKQSSRKESSAVLHNSIAYYNQRPSNSTISSHRLLLWPSYQLLLTHFWLLVAGIDEYQ